MFVAVAAIVDDQVERAARGHQMRQKIGVNLAALQHLHPVTQIELFFLNINAGDLRQRKVIAPGGQRLPAPVLIRITADANFQHVDRAVAEPFEQLVIVRRVVVIAELVGAMLNRQNGKRVDHGAAPHLFLF